MLFSINAKSLFHRHEAKEWKDLKPACSRDLRMILIKFEENVINLQLIIQYTLLQ